MIAEKPPPAAEEDENAAEAPASDTGTVGPTSATARLLFLRGSSLPLTPPPPSAASSSQEGHCATSASTDAPATWRMKGRGGSISFSSSSSFLPSSLPLLRPPSLAPLCPPAFSSSPPHHPAASSASEAVSGRWRSVIAAAAAAAAAAVAAAAATGEGEEEGERDGGGKSPLATRNSLHPVGGDDAAKGRSCRMFSPPGGRSSSDAREGRGAAAAGVDVVAGSAGQGRQRGGPSGPRGGPSSPRGGPSSPRGGPSSPQGQQLAKRPLP